MPSGIPWPALIVGALTGYSLWRWLKIAESSLTDDAAAQQREAERKAREQRRLAARDARWEEEARVARLEREQMATCLALQRQELQEQQEHSRAAHSIISAAACGSPRIVSPCRSASRPVMICDAVSPRSFWPVADSDADEEYEEYEETEVEWTEEEIATFLREREERLQAKAAAEAAARDRLDEQRRQEADEQAVTAWLASEQWTEVAGKAGRSSARRSSSSSSSSSSASSHRLRGASVLRKLDPPVPGLHGRWVLREKFRGKKSFSYFECACGRHWTSAHGWRKYRQKCSGCGGWMFPHQMWLNDARSAVKPSAAREGAEKPHLENSCEACLEFGHSCWKVQHE